jgi:hypothetical protein
MSAHHTGDSGTCASMHEFESAYFFPNKKKQEGAVPCNVRYDTVGIPEPDAGDL